MSFFKRMGSAASSSNSVQAVSLDQQNANHKRPSSTKGAKLSKDKEIGQLNEQLTNIQVLLEQSEKTNRNHQEEISNLQEKLLELETENEKLVEQNQALEDRIETLESQPLVGDTFDINESLKIKEIEIAKLQAELQASEDASKSLKQKFKAKVKSLKVTNSKSKQEQSLKMFELKDEISALQQENEELREKLTALGHQNYSDGEDNSSNNLAQSDGRSNIIIELSTQISEQEFRISVLEEQLEEKDQMISKLQSARLSPREAQSIIAVEAEKTTQEMQALAKELKMLKRKKKKAKMEEISSKSKEQEYNRELSSLSRDSGAIDLSSPNNLKFDSQVMRRKAYDDTETFSLITPSHSATSFTSTSTLVT